MKYKRLWIAAGSALALLAMLAAGLVLRLSVGQASQPAAVKPFPFDTIDPQVKPGAPASPTTGFLKVSAHGRGAWRINPNGPAVTASVLLPMIYTVPDFPVLRNADFEQGHTAWVESSSNFPDLITQQGVGGAPAAQSGTWLAWLGGGYNEISDLSQQVTVPAGTEPIYLYFYYEITSLETNCSASAPSDALYLYVNDAYADKMVVCSAYNTGANWTSRAFNKDLSAYAGQTVTLHLKSINNGTLVSSVFLDTFSFSHVQTAQSTPGSGLQTPPGIQGTAGDPLARFAPLREVFSLIP